jgi:hypothetical protein
MRNRLNKMIETLNNRIEVLRPMGNESLLARYHIICCIAELNQIMDEELVCRECGKDMESHDIKIACPAS